LGWNFIPLQFRARRCAGGGERLAKEQVDRLTQRSPVMHGEILITAYGGNVFMKRYGGVDVVADL